MTKTIDRLIQFINHIGLSARQFDISIGASNGYTLRMKKNHASVGSDVLETVLQTYPDLNVVWLLTGEGVMLKSQMEDEVLDFEKLPAEKKAIIEKIIEDKIRERQHQALRNLVKEVAKEFNN